MGKPLGRFLLLAVKQKVRRLFIILTLSNTNLINDQIAVSTIHNITEKKMISH